MGFQNDDGAIVVGADVARWCMGLARWNDARHVLWKLNLTAEAQRAQSFLLN